MKRAVLLALLLLPGCATIHGLTHSTHRGPVRQNQGTAQSAPAAKAEQAAGTEMHTPVQKAVASPAASGPGSTNPMMGFRPMRGQTNGGI